MVTAAAKRMPAHAWWSTFGGSIPELQNVAVKVLAQVSTGFATFTVIDDARKLFLIIFSSYTLTRITCIASLT